MSAVRGGDAGSAGATTAQAIGRVVALWRPRAGRLGFGLLLSIASALLGVALLAAAGEAVASGRHATIGVGALVLGAGLGLRLLGVGRIGLRYAERLATHDAMFRALADLRVWFFRRIAASAASGLGFRRSADLLSRLVADVEALDALYLRILVPLLASLAALPVLVLVLAGRDGPLALTAALLFVCSVLIVPLGSARASFRAGARTAASMSSLRIAILDALTGLREVRAFGAEGRVLANMQAREAALLGAQLGARRRMAILDAVGALAGQAAMLAVLAAIATGLGGGAGGSIFVIVAVLVLLASFDLASALPRAGVLAGIAAAAARRVVEAAGSGRSDGADRGEAGGGGARLPADLTLRFEAIRFERGAGRPVLSDLSLAVVPGSRVVILGPSGAGKSTLAALALALAHPDAGRVTLGGVDVRDLDPAALRRTIALLNQSTHLFADTIRANLLIGRPDADEAALWQALDDAALGDWVRSLPDRLDTWLDEGGAAVSGGEGRRIALARALLSAAPILILDEPASGLDSDAERQFFQALDRSARGRTVILIAHRLTGVERPDRIWRLSGGRASVAAA